MGERVRLGTSELSGGMFETVYMTVTSENETEYEKLMLSLS